MGWNIESAAQCVRTHAKPTLAPILVSHCDVVHLVASVLWIMSWLVAGAFVQPWHVKVRLYMVYNV